MTEQLESQTTDTPVVVSREVSHPLEAVWDVLLTPSGMAALLGEGAQLGDKGETWHAADGSFGVTRSFHPMEQIRFSWHADEAAPRTLVDVHLAAEGPSATRIEIRHEHVSADQDRQQLEAHWQAALNRIELQAA